MEHEADLWAALQDVHDPEMPISIVDMGLIYGLEAHDGSVHVKLTFTAMGCPAMEFILEDVEQRLREVPGVDRVEIEVVWDPPWTKERLTEAGREALLYWGIVT